MGEVSKVDVLDEDLYQDSVSQFPFLNGYTDLLYGFKVKEDVPRDSIIEALRDAFQTIAYQIPLIGNQIILVPGDDGTSGTYHPAPWPQECPVNEILRIKDCDYLMPSMAELLRASAPVSMLPASVLTPWPGLPLPHGLSPPLPVVAAQANFIHGGLLLNISQHHIALDGGGQIQLLRLLSTVLSGQQIPSSSVAQANRDRRQVVPLIPALEPVKDHPYLRRPPHFKAPLPRQSAKWCYYSVPLRGLPSLRRDARFDMPDALPVSDNDILCAFTWQRISVVRHARGDIPPSTCVKFTRAIDGRSALGIPATYLGQLIHHAIARLPLHTVATAPLSEITQVLRRELKATNTEWGIRSYATQIARERDKGCLVYGGVRDVNVDLGATSIVASSGDEAAAAAAGGGGGMPVDFGVLGKMCFLRRPNVASIPGTVFITPAEGGAMMMNVCLPERDLEALSKDKEWTKYTRCIG